MSRLVITIICLFLFNLGFGQQKSFDLVLGDEFKDENFTYPPSIFAMDGSGYYMVQNKSAAYVGLLFIPIKVSKEGFFLKKFDAELKAEKTVSVELGKGRTKEKPFLAYASLENIHLFSTRQDKSKRSHVLYHRPIDRATLGFPEEGTPIAEVSYNGYPKFKYPNFQLARSQDSSKVLLHCKLPTDKKDPEKFQVHVFNEEMIQLWTSKFVLPYAENQLIIQSYKISNEGRVFVLAKYYETPKAKRYEYTYKLFVLSPGFEKPDEYELGFDGKPLANMKLQMEPNDDILCLGTYLEGEKRNYNVKGIFVFKLNGTTLKPENKRFVELSKEVRQSLISEEKEAVSKKSKKDDSDDDYVLSNNISFNKIVLRSDGGALMVGEISYEYTTSHYVQNGNGGGYWVYRTNYVRGNIVAISIGPNGDIEKIERVKKSQKGVESFLYLSYGMAVTRSNLRFIFNDRLENVNLGPNESPRTYYPSNRKKHRQSMTLVTLNQDGSKNREAVLNAKETGMHAFPLGAKQVSSSEMVFVLQNGKNRRLAKLEFK